MFTIGMHSKDGLPFCPEDAWNKSGEKHIPMNLDKARDRSNLTHLFPHRCNNVYFSFLTVFLKIKFSKYNKNLSSEQNLTSGAAVAWMEAPAQIGRTAYSSILVLIYSQRFTRAEHYICTLGLMADLTMHLVSCTGSNAAATPTSHLFQLMTVKRS